MSRRAPAAAAAAAQRAEPGKAVSQGPALPLWHCDLKPLDGTGAATGSAKLDNLTVGVKFVLDCSGDIPVHWNSQQDAKLVFSEKTPPGILALLEKRKLEETSAEFVVTSYRAGQMKPEYVRVMSGEQGFEASGLEWNVQTVIKQQGQQQPQPYGPIGPFALPLPGWVWLIVALIVATIGAAIYVWFQAYQYRRRLRTALAEFAKGGPPPSAQFHRDIRHLSKRVSQSPDTKGIDDWSNIVDQAVRVYLLREYQYLTVKVPRSALFAGLRKKNPKAYEDGSRGLAKLYSEMDRFRSHATQHRPVEFDQILRIATAWCDYLEKEKARHL